VNSLEAKRILIAHRSGRGASDDSQLLEALEQARRDPVLHEWWKQQEAFHAAMQRGFSQVPVPSGLREQISARTKIISFPWWRRPPAWAAAAAIILLLGLSTLLWTPSSNGSFATFRSRMVRFVLLQYRMDIQTNDMVSINQFLDTNHAPADYVLPPGLKKLPPLGAGLPSWQGSRVSMVCFDSRTRGTLFLFIADRSEMKRPPTKDREYAQVNKLMTVSWTDGGKVYVLAGEGSRETFERYF